MNFGPAASLINNDVVVGSVTKGTYRLPTPEPISDGKVEYGDTVRVVDTYAGAASAAVVANAPTRMVVGRDPSAIEAIRAAIERGGRGRRLDSVR